MAGVTLRGLKKRYGETEVIHGVDLDVAEGEFCVFVGPSGCGKSTLLRMIAGLEDISGGELKFGDRVVNEVDPAQRGVAMVFQTYALYPHMSVEENMGFGLRMTGTPREEIASRVGEAAEILQLGPLLKRKPKALSGGQRQRVAIGRAIVRNPQVFLFDEPLSNLDAELRVQMRVEIARLHRELAGVTMIYVTHDQVEAMTLADKIVVLRDGVIEQTGAPLQLYDDPDNIFVAGFIGSPRMNFMAGEVVAAEGDTTIKLTGQGGATLSLPLARTPAIGAKVTIGVRPEHFAHDAAARLRLNVDVAEHLGGASYIHALSAEGERLIIEDRDGRGARPNDVLETGFDPARAHVFDAAGARVR